MHQVGAERSVEDDMKLQTTFDFKQGAANLRVIFAVMKENSNRAVMIKSLISQAKDHWINTYEAFALRQSEEIRVFMKDQYKKLTPLNDLQWL